MNSDEKLVVRTRKSFGRIIQEYRQRNGWTQEELAWRAEITREHVGRIERDKCVPSVATIKKLEQAFHLPEMTLAKWVIAPSDRIEGDSKDESDVGRICQEFGRALAANLHRADLNESELFRVGEAIGTFTDLLKGMDKSKDKK